jgi:hypothetical protein
LTLKYGSPTVNGRWDFSTLTNDHLHMALEYVPLTLVGLTLTLIDLWCEWRTTEGPRMRRERQKRVERQRSFIKEQAELGSILQRPMEAATASLETGSPTVLSPRSSKHLPPLSSSTSSPSLSSPSEYESPSGEHGRLGTFADQTSSTSVEIKFKYNFP